MWPIKWNECSLFMNNYTKYLIFNNLSTVSGLNKLKCWKKWLLVVDLWVPTGQLAIQQGIVLGCPARLCCFWWADNQNFEHSQEGVKSLPKEHIKFVSIRTYLTNLCITRTMQSQGLVGRETWNHFVECTPSNPDGFFANPCKAMCLNVRHIGEAI